MISTYRNTQIKTIAEKLEAVYELHNIFKTYVIHNIDNIDPLVDELFKKDFPLFERMFFYHIDHIGQIDFDSNYSVVIIGKSNITDYVLKQNMIELIII